MQLFRRWHYDAVDAELAALPPANTSSTDPEDLVGEADGGNAITASGRLSSSGGPRLLALSGATIEEAMPPQPWPQMNAIQSLLGGLAVLSGRRLVLPAINCTATVEMGQNFLNPGMLPNRCFWHVHSRAGVACVFRIGGCGETMNIASPTELQDALSRGDRAATVTLDLADAMRSGSGSNLRRNIAGLLKTHTDVEVVLVRLAVPPVPSTGVDGFWATQEAVEKFHAKLGGAVRKFRRVCPELTDRSKRRKRECTNVC